MVPGRTLTVRRADAGTSPGIVSRRRSVPQDGGDAYVKEHPTGMGHAGAAPLRRRMLLT